MRRYALRDDQWERIKDLLPGRLRHARIAEGPALGDRVEAVEPAFAGDRPRRSPRGRVAVPAAEPGRPGQAARRVRVPLPRRPAFEPRAGHIERGGLAL